MNLLEKWSNKLPYDVAIGKEIVPTDNKGESLLSENDNGLPTYPDGKNAGIDYLNDPDLPVLESTKEKIDMANMLETAETWLRNSGGKVLASMASGMNESINDISNVADFFNILLPVIRRALPRTDIKDIATTLTTNSPTRTIYVQKTYFSGKGDTDSGDYYDANGDPTIFAITIPENDTQYDAITVGSTGTGSDITDTTSTTVVGHVLYKEKRFDGSITLLVKQEDGETLTDVGSDVTIETVTSTVGYRVEGEIGRMMLFRNYNTSYVRGEAAKQTSFNEVNITYKDFDVKTETRALVFRYDIPMMQDILGFFGDSGKKYLIESVVYQFSKSLSMNIFNAAVTSASNAPEFVYDTAPTTATFSVRPEDRYKDLARKVLKEAKLQGKRNGMMNANKLVVSRNVSAIFEEMDDFVSVNSNGIGITKIGRWKQMDVYVNNFVADGYDFVYLCTKLNDFDAPVIYLTYKPLWMAETTNQDNPMNRLMMFYSRDKILPRPEHPEDFGTLFTVNLAGSPFE